MAMNRKSLPSRITDAAYTQADKVRVSVTIGPIVFHAEVPAHEAEPRLDKFEAAVVRSFRGYSGHVHGPADTATLMGTRYRFPFTSSHIRSLQAWRDAERTGEKCSRSWKCMGFW